MASSPLEGGAIDSDMDVQVSKVRCWSSSPLASCRPSQVEDPILYCHASQSGCACHEASVASCAVCSVSERLRCHLHALCIYWQMAKRCRIASDDQGHAQVKSEPTTRGRSVRMVNTLLDWLMPRLPDGQREQLKQAQVRRVVTTCPICERQESEPSVAPGVPHSGMCDLWMSHDVLRLSRNLSLLTEILSRCHQGECPMPAPKHIQVPMNEPDGCLLTLLTM